MIYWHKILPMLVLPVGIVLVLLLVAAFTKKRGVSLLAAFVLLFFSLPLTSSFLIRAAEDFAVRLRIGEIQPADGADISIPLNTTIASAGGTVTEWMDPDRFFAGVELFKAEKAAVLVFTGGKMPWLPDSPPEGQIFKQLAVQLGVPVDRIIVTTDVQNTEEEAREVRARVGDGKTVILVTSAYHMPRARQLFVASGVNVIPFPVDFKVEAGGTFTILDVLPSAVSLWKSETAIRELFGRAFYTVKLALSPPH